MRYIDSHSWMLREGKVFNIDTEEWEVGDD